MKTLATELAFFLRGRGRQNLKALIFYCAFLVLLVLIYAVIFRYLMWHLEGREFSLIAGIYWTITVMTTLGFGDITFHNDLGYVFAAIVTVSGVVFLLIILPFGLISLFLAPWIENRLRHRLTYELPAETSGHVVIFGVDATTRSFVGKIQARNIPFVIVTADHDQAQRLEDEGLRVVCGAPTDPGLFQALRIESARYVVANLSDPENASLCLTIRSRFQTPIAAFVDDAEHRSLMGQAGANQVIALHKILGRYLAVRATTRGALAHVLDSFGDLQIAEIPVHGTPFAGETLEKARIGQQTGLAVIGIWERGNFTVPSRQTVINENALLVLAGTKAQLQSLADLTGEVAKDDLIFIIGHGRIGCAAAHFLESRPVPYILIDREENPVCHEHVPILGDATFGHVLADAGIARAKGLIVTTNDDHVNIFLTLTVRQLLPHVRLVARANHESSVEPLYLAGADFVVSNASVGASILLNVLESKASAFLTEGITVFRRALPKFMEGKTISQSELRELTGCSIVAMETPDGETMVSPPPETILEEGSILIMISTPEQEAHFDGAVKNR